jgi:hypothetical protein
VFEPVSSMKINLFSTFFQPFSTWTNEINRRTLHFTLKLKKMKKRNLFMSTTIMCGLFAVAFTFKLDQITWLWANNKPVGIILVIMTIVLGIQWVIQQKLLNKAKQS